LGQKQLWDGSILGDRGKNNSGRARFWEIEGKTTLEGLDFWRLKEKQFWDGSIFGKLSFPELFLP
jgi:hypothetical protein